MLRHMCGHVLQALLLLRSCAGAASSALTIGVCNDMKNNPLMPAVTLAYEDMRRAGQTLVHLPHLGNDTMVSFIFRDDACDPTRAIAAGIDFMGLGVNAILGCKCSSSSEVMARIASIGNIPEIAWISMASYFTLNHQYYASFMRTIPPLGGNPPRLLDVLTAFKWRYAKFFHLNDPSSNLFDDDVAYSTTQLAQARGITIFPVALPVRPATSDGGCPAGWRLSSKAADCVDQNAWKVAIDNSRRLAGLINLVYMSFDGGTLTRIAAQEGLLQQVWILTDPIVWPVMAQDLSTIEYFDGCLGLGYDPAGPEAYPYRQFKEYWRANVTLDVYRDVLPPIVLPILASRQPLGAATETELSTYNTPRLLDALTTLYIAFDAMLGAGVRSEEVRGRDLLQAMHHANFEGASGAVSFDALGDIASAGGMDLFNLQGGQRVFVASWTPSGLQFKVGARVVWPGNSTSPPSGVRTPCAEGFYFDGLTCVGCGQGLQPASGSGEDCSPCPRGTAGVNLCLQCEPGFYSNQTGLSSCRLCPAGFQCGAWGIQNPVPCPRGSVSSAAAGLNCSVCVSGMYADQEAQTSCASCAPPTSSRPMLWRTMQRLAGVSQWVLSAGATTQGACGCQAGSYMLRGDCAPCGTGMLCPGMGEVQLEVGFAALAENPGEVFQCFGNKLRCPGGPPGTCAANRDPTSLACTSCLPGMHAGDGGGCEACSGADYLPIVLVGLAMGGALCLIYYLQGSESRITQGKAAVTVALATSQLVTVIQQLGVLNLIGVTWPEQLTRVFSFLTMLNLDLEVLRLECFGRVGSTSRFTMRVFCIFGLLLVMGLIHVVVIVALHGGRFRGRSSALIGSTGQIFMSFLVSIVAALAAPMQCQMHPNGLSTVRAYPDVVCWSDAHDSPHRKMVLISLCACLLPVAFVVAAFMVLWTLNGRMRDGDVQYLHTYSFLLFRFRIECRWYVLVFVIRNFLVALTPIIPDAAAQVLFMFMVLLSTVMLTAHLLPWRVHQAHLLCVLTNLVILTVLVVAGFCITNLNAAILTIFCCVLFGTIVFAVIGVVVAGLYARFLRAGKPFQFFLCHHKAGAGNLARLLKMQLQEHRSVRRKIFLDSDDLRDLNNLISIVQGDLEKLVVLCSKEILLRVWCIGEISAAFANKVTVIRVQLPEFALPTSAFIDACQEHISNLMSLSAYGISVQMVQDALRWFRTTPQVILNCRIGLPAVTLVVEHLVSTGLPECALLDEPGREAPNRIAFEEFIVADQSSSEAVCAAYIIKKLLICRLPPGKPQRMPQVLGADEVLPDSVEQVVLVCTNGVFQRPHVLAALVKASAVHAAVMPVVSDVSYRFPTQAFYDTLRADGASILLAIGNPCSVGDLIWIVEAIFMEIAVEVNPQDSENMLQLRAGDLAKRLTSRAVRQLTPSTARSGAPDAGLATVPSSMVHFLRMPSDAFEAVRL